MFKGIKKFYRKVRKWYRKGIKAKRLYVKISLLMGTLAVFLPIITKVINRVFAFVK